VLLPGGRTITIVVLSAYEPCLSSKQGKVASNHKKTVVVVNSLNFLSLFGRGWLWNEFLKGVQAEGQIGNFSRTNCATN